jgi:ankyrin repeat protein
LQRYVAAESTAIMDQVSVWKKELGKACIADDETKVRSLLSREGIDQTTRESGFQIALQKATSRKSVKQRLALLLLNEFDASQQLSDEGFRSILLQLVDTDRSDLLELLRLLLRRGYRTSLNEKDRKNQALHLTPLLFAAVPKLWKDSLKILLDAGADVHTEFKNGQTLLMTLAAEKGPETPDSLYVVDLLVKHGANVSHHEPGKKNALHWAASTGKVEMVKILLNAKPDEEYVELTSERGRTALHYAAAGDCGDDTIVNLLLNAGAKHDTKSDGHWTPLHNAAQRGNLKAVERLLMAGADPNATLSSRVTPLHWAAAKGHEEVVKCFLARKDVQKHKRDALGSTPMIWAAQHGHKNIAKLFHPCHDVPLLSVEQTATCRSNTFRATVVDFERSGGQGPPGSIVKRISMWDLLYEEKFTISANPYPSESKQRRMAQEKEKKRQKASKAEPTSPVGGNTLAENEHDAAGHTDESVTHAGPKKKKFRWIHLPANNMAWVETLFNKLFIEEEVRDVDSFKALQKTLGHQHRGRHPHSTFMIPHCAHTRPTPTHPSWLADDGIISQNPQVIPAVNSNASSRPLETETEGEHITYGNIALFMPYLHFESHERRQQMTETIKSVSSSGNSKVSSKTLQENPDEVMLVRAYLNSSQSLHPRRTLDQFLYHSFDTEKRDIDQVVYRYLRDKLNSELKVYMVDQLWLWIWGEDLIVTSFPQRWGQVKLKNDPLCVLEGIIEDINSKTRPPVRSVHDLAMVATGRCSGGFDRHRIGDQDYQFMSMFDESIGDLAVREPELFEAFETASNEAADWLRDQQGQRVTQKGEKLNFVDNLLDIKAETTLLKELKDIRDELNIIKSIFSHQNKVLNGFKQALHKERHQDRTEVSSRFQEQSELTKLHMEEVERMDSQAHAIFNSLTQLLDFKQKHANAIEARFAREQAEFTAGQADLTRRQGETIMIFTIVTIFVSFPVPQYRA